MSCQGPHRSFMQKQETVAVKLPVTSYAGQQEVTSESSTSPVSSTSSNSSPSPASTSDSPMCNLLGPANETQIIAGEEPCMALVDTGSMITSIGEDFYRKHLEEQHPLQDLID